jgi:RNA polymerase sigma factor (sigma-70 family)
VRLSADQIERKAKIHRLVAEAQTGDVAARNALIELELDWIKHRVRTAIGPGMVDEYLGEAVEIYIKIVGLFDPERKCTFRTFAGGIIHRELRTSRYTNSGLIRLPRSVSKDASEEVRRLADCSKRISQFDPAKSRKARMPPLDQQDTLEKLREYIGYLPGKWRRVMRDRLAGRSLDETAADMGVTAQRVQQISVQAINRLARHFGCDPLPKYLQPFRHAKK